MIKLANQNNNLVLPFLTLPTICEPVSDQLVALAKEFKHLLNQELAGHGCVKGNLEIYVLIGANHYYIGSL